MIVCPDCREALADLQLACPRCNWTPICERSFFDYLSSSDRSSMETASYIDIYDALALRNLSAPIESSSYIESLAKRLIAAIGSLADKDLCDVGSGRGYFIREALKHKPRSVTAVDIAAPSLKAVAETYPVRAFLANAEHLPFEREFDVLIATDILEHVLNTSNFLVTANWALRDGGRLVIRVPYLENMLGYSNFFGLPMHFTHLRTYDRATLVHTIQCVGFAVESIHYSGIRPDYMAAWLDRFPRLREFLRRKLAQNYGVDDASDAPFAEWLMKPIEIGAIARKVTHIEANNWHTGLADFYAKRRDSKSAPVKIPHSHNNLQGSAKESGYSYDPDLTTDDAS